MNLENVVLVRVMNRIPLDGMLIPSCKGKYLTKKGLSDFKDIIRDIVKKELENKLGRQLNLWIEEDDKYFESIVSEYYPYTSCYTSTLSFSLNGMVPDDINNNFSEKKVAVIDPIKYHQNEDFVTVDVIDTTIKGDMKVSPEAILVIDESVFNSLSQDDQNNLLINYKVEVFKGHLRDAVPSILTKYNYPALPLIQKRDYKDILDCPERGSMLHFQDAFADVVGASRLKLQYLYTKPIDFLYSIDKKVAPKVQSDFKKNLIVENYYRSQLYNFLVSKLEESGIVLSDEEKYYLFSNYSDSKIILEKLVNALCNVHGLDGMQQIVAQFNQNMMDNYLTNDEIVALDNGARKQ